MYRYNPSIGQGAAFVPDSDAAAFTFGPNGNLFVSDGNAVLQYDGTDGSLVNSFVAPGSGGLSLSDPISGMAFGPNGDLFLTCDTQPGQDVASLMEFDGSNGSFVRSFDILTDRTGAANLTFGAVPEPTGLALFGLLFLLFHRRKASRFFEAVNELQSQIYAA